MLLKEVKHTRDVDTSNLAAKRDFMALKAEVDKLDINKFFNVPICLNNLKLNVDDLGANKIKTWTFRQTKSANSL